MPIRRPFSFSVLACAAAMVSISALRPVHAEQLPIWEFDTEISALVAPRIVESLLPITPVPVAPARDERSTFSPRQLLADLANRLRDIRYKRGGREPSTGFDCSGFVHYVFRQGIGVDLPNTSAAQFNSGEQIDRSELRSGDLVFFRTRGKRVSHVGMYLDDGRFIHAPSTGKRVSVSSLSEPYWARRFAGAKRPQVLAVHEDGDLAKQG